MDLRIYDTLERRVVPFTTERPGEVRMYTCGPTVYRPVHLGNLRSYLLADWLRRTLVYFGNRVTAIKNITDVGHMRQERVALGEDKVIAAALAQGKTPREIADHYEAAFHADERRLGIVPADAFPRATEYVPQMISMVETLVSRDAAYVVEGDVYFAVARAPGYGRLSGNPREALRHGVRAEIDPKKRHPADFALWKSAEPDRAALTWNSPWGPGFPGWHIECSAMSAALLGEHVDLHTGGVDNIFPHHDDEIAQSEAAFGHPTVRHWVHGQHLLAEGVKMAKSARNTLTVGELDELAIDPLAFRYQCLLTHYRARMDFSIGALRQAEAALDHLRQRIRHWSQLGTSDSDAPTRDRWLSEFREALADDLNLPRGVAVLQRAAADASASERTKLEILITADVVLGLDLASVAGEATKAPREVLASVDEHVVARASRDFRRADSLRAAFDGYRVDDHPADRAVISRADRRASARERHEISSGKELPDRRGERASRSWTVAIVTREFADDLGRGLASVGRYLPADAEIVVLDSGSRDETQGRIHAFADGDARTTILFADRDFGEGAARNALLRIARGRLVLQLDTSVELVGDLFTKLEEAFADAGVGLAGPWGLRTADLKHFDEAVEGEVDAIQGYCAAARRDVLLEIGGFDDRYRFYRNLDIAVSLAIREKGHRAIATGADLAIRHEHRIWEALSEDERLRRSRRNFDRMYRRFHGRVPLVASPV